MEFEKHRRAPGTMRCWADAPAEERSDCETTPVRGNMTSTRDQREGSEDVN